MASEVTFLSAITCAASMYFLLLTLGVVAWWGWVLIAAALAAGGISLWAWYKHLLVDNQ
jgi:hypothetical protein